MLSRIDARQPVELANKISDRHFGVGSDGLILICPSDVADARMRMFNADGSESEMCGNGVRCVAKYVYDHGICRNEILRIETGRGVLTLKLEMAGGKVARVEVDMGEPILEPAKIPVQFPKRFDGDRIVDFPAGEYIPFRSSKPWMADCGWDRSDDLRLDGQSRMLFYSRKTWPRSLWKRSVHTSSGSRSFPTGSMSTSCRSTARRK